MKKVTITVLSLLFAMVNCKPDRSSDHFSISEKAQIEKLIQKEINEGIEATRTKNIDLYMSQMPDDLKIFDESGEVISKQKQREYALRDWAIIDTTLSIHVHIDSIQYIAKDSIVVFTSQRWKRMMFQRDGKTTDTVLTTQKHREVWKKTKKGWFGYEIEELGGEIFVNGNKYIID